MASRRSDFHANGGGRYIYTDHPMMSNGYDSFTSTALFEFNESDMWGGGLQTQIPPLEHSRTKLKPKPKPDQKTKTKMNHQEEMMVKLSVSSLPLNIPDWSRILKDHHRQSHRKRETEDDYDDGDDDDDRDRVPPHEILAWRRGASLSVQEGIGRTLKGRDLSRVRNAVWKRTGFED